MANNVESNVTVEDVGRGIEESRPEGSKTRIKTHGQSKKLVASLNARVDDVEKSTGDLKVRIDDLDHHLEDVQQQLGVLEAEDSEVREDVKATLDILKLEFRREVEDLRGIIRGELATLRAQVERVEREQGITMTSLKKFRPTWAFASEPWRMG